MGKKVKRLFLVFAVVFTIVLSASELNNSVLQISSRLKSAAKTDIVKIYHDLKSKYIKAIINDDKEAQISAIKGLIKSSKILNISYAHYEEELSLLLKGKRSQKTKSPIGKKYQIHILSQ